MRVSALILLAGLWLAGCAATTEFTRTRHEAPPARPAHSLIIAGVTPDEKLRRIYEYTFITELQKNGIAGVASSDLIPSIAGMDMTTLRERMAQFSDRADAVLHVQLMGLARTPAQSPTDMPADYAPPSKKIGGIDFTLNAPASRDAGSALLDVEISANLYELPARRLLWIGLSSTREDSDPRHVARSHARAMIAELQAGGYLTGKP